MIFAAEEYEVVGMIREERDNCLADVEKLSERFMCYAGWLVVEHGVDIADLKHISDLLDAEENGRLARVVHGEWVDNGIPDSVLDGCSVCGFTCGAYSFNFCPNCGADMRKKSNDEEIF